MSYDSYFRIIDTDNFGGDYPEETFHLFPLPKDAAQKVCDILNEHCGGDFATRFYKVVPYDYKLQPGLTP